MKQAALLIGLLLILAAVTAVGYFLVKGEEPEIVVHRNTAHGSSGQGPAVVETVARVGTGSLAAVAASSAVLDATSPLETPTPARRDQGILAADPEAAAKLIPRVEPRMALGLPREIRDALQNDGCTIPQSARGASVLGVSNIAHGSLAAPGQVDWAVLCSKEGVSEVRLFWGGKAGCPPPETWADGADADSKWMSRVAEGDDANNPRWEFRRSLRVVQPAKSPHLAISDGNGDTQVSEVYCDKGAWVELVQPE